MKPPHTAARLLCEALDEADYVHRESLCTLLVPQSKLRVNAKLRRKTGGLPRQLPGLEPHKHRAQVIAVQVRPRDGAAVAWGAHQLLQHRRLVDLVLRKFHHAGARHIVPAAHHLARLCRRRHKVDAGRVGGPRCEAHQSWQSHEEHLHLRVGGHLRCACQQFLADAVDQISRVGSRKVVERHKYLPAGFVVIRFIARNECLKLGAKGVTDSEEWQARGWPDIRPLHCLERSAETLAALLRYLCVIDVEVIWCGDDNQAAIVADPLQQLVIGHLWIGPEQRAAHKMHHALRSASRQPHVRALHFQPVELAAALLRHLRLLQPTAQLYGQRVLVHQQRAALVVLPARARHPASDATMAYAS
mmetsp:Transcript_24327/g.61268  ORF Transcript_24327/g.61268 Transcript_24327/m.61268 type:complete len:360 (-) Transcript_24327:63-1142(-)